MCLLQSNTDDEAEAETLTEPPLKRSDSVEVKAKELLDTGMISTTEYEALTSAPRMSMEKPRSIAKGAKKIIGNIGKMYVLGRG